MNILFRNEQVEFCSVKYVISASVECIESVIDSVVKGEMLHLLIHII